jgi:CspA family cold shock protein
MNQDSKENSGEYPNESSADESASEPVGETTVKSVDESATASSEESTETTEEMADESAEEVIEESVDESIEESAEEVTEESAEEAIEESAATSAEEPSDEPVEDTSEQSPVGDVPGDDLPVVRGTVKWFNAEKGFGFIVADDGSGDVFLHLSALRNEGLETVSGGATIVCAVSRGPKGLQVDRVIEVDESTASPSVQHRPRSPLGYDRPRHPPLADVGEFVAATVKWFNPNKGFGFITVDETSPDVFVHMQTLRRCGVATLDSGQEVRVRIGQGAKGPQVAEIDSG